MTNESKIVCRVECYAGYRGEETPRSIFLQDKEIIVVRVLDSWLAPDHRYFKVCGDDDGLYIIRHSVKNDEWELTLYDSGRMGPTGCPPPSATE